MKNWERVYNEIIKDGWNAETFPAIKRFIKRLLKQKWEKEFEDSLSFDSLDYFGVENEELGRLVMNFIGEWDTKVKIKCKDGCIQIERVK